MTTTTSNSTEHHTKQHLLDELTAIRDKARVRIHLLSLDARDRWAEFETRIDGIEQTLKGGGERLASVSKHILELRRAVGEFLAAHPHVPALDIAVSRVMTHNVKTCRSSDSLAYAAAVLWDEDLGVLPVVSHDGHVVGMLTDRDICMAAYTQGSSLHDLPVSIAMSRGVHSCSVDDTLQGVANSIAQYQVRRMPVLSVEGRLIGIITLGDLNRFAASLPESELANRVILRLLSSVTQRRNSRISTAA